MKPLYHAKLSAKKFGGRAEDYQAIHDWFDQVKAHVPDARHRIVLHNSWGIFLCEQVFGTALTNSDGKEVPVRSVAEQHVIDDLGRIPSLVELLDQAKLHADILGGKKLRRVVISSNNIIEEE